MVVRSVGSAPALEDPAGLLSGCSGASHALQPVQAPAARPSQESAAAPLLFT